MSITAGLVPQVQEKNYKKSFHQIRHNDSGELDVFEAARYFSGASEISGSNFTQQKIMRSGGRISLDIPMMSSSSSSSTSRSSIPAQTHHHHHHLHVLEKATKENNNKKYKQPNSPGGRLASFLNSLFSSQISSKKKKSSKSSSSTQSVKDEDESPSGRRKRRSSISHFPSVNTMNSNSADSKSSMYSSSSSGFRTPPPPNSNSAPKKNSSYKDLRSYSDHKPVVMSTNINFSKNNNGHVKFTTSTNGLSSSEKFKTFGNGLLDHNTPLEERDQYIKFINEVDIDDGADSDSSSDLFELPNYDLSGLPVYETTHMDSIKRGAPITSTGAI